MAAFEDGRKAVNVNFKHIVQTYNARMTNATVNLVFASHVLGEALLLGIGPPRIELVNLDRHFM